MTIFLSLSAQREIDSLIQLTKTSVPDTNKVNNLLVLAKKYPLKDSASARKTFNEAIDLAVKLKYTKGISVAYCQKAGFILNTHDDSTAFSCLNELLQYIDTVKPNKHHIKYLITVASICANSSQFNRAVNTYLRVLKISDAISDKNGSAMAYFGLCFMNIRLVNPEKAKYYGLKALQLYKELNDEASCVKVGSNLGGVYLSEHFKTKSEESYKLALEYFSETAETALKLGDISVAASCFSNLGALYGFRGEYAVALTYARKALELKRQIGSKYSIATTMLTLSDIFCLQKKADSIPPYAFKALELSKEINAPDVTKHAYDNLFVYYELKKDYPNALKYHKLFKNLSDSLQLADKQKSLAEAESKYESEKKDKEISVLNQLREAKDQELSKQKIINYIIAISLVLLLMLSFFILRQYSEKKKANKLLETQNELINEKNRNITDSINYAKVIQAAILPAENDVISIFKEAFVLFKPKDIVSGDFYWCSEKNGRKIVAAVDCTGHGVPGAFMSMIGTTFLNEIVNEKGITNPADILGELRNRVKTSLKQRGLEGESKDGMDMALLSFSEDLSTVDYAGANNSLWRIKATTSEVEETSPDKRPIGYFKGQGLPFTNHTIELAKGDTLYIFTDGYADQFGGDKVRPSGFSFGQGKKFKYRQLKELLVRIQNKSMKEQKEILIESLERWKGLLEQTDDICVIGIKV
ncbi:MAG: yrrB 5 [Bacteroidetes bacterium]|nr:yrrB 5 [Bacteroidota bacterium]